MRNYLLGLFIAVTALAVAACGGQGAPGSPYPGLNNVGGGSLPAGGSQTITMPQVSGLGVGSVTITGAGTVSASQSVSNPSAVPVLALKHRASSSATHPDQTSNTPIAYVTVTASSTASLSTVALKLAPTATIPSGTYYLAFWNGSQWVTAGNAASISGGIVSVSTGNLSPAISLASGSSFYAAVYTGEIFTTPSPPPPAPVASPSSLTLDIGLTGQVTVTSGESIQIKATSSSPGVATVTASATTPPNGTTATFTVTAVALGTTTITFTDPLNRTTTTAVTVNNASPTPEPSPATATIGLTDVVPVTISAHANTLITVTSTSSSIAGVATTSGGSPSGTVQVTTNGSGAATVYVTGVGGGSTTITFADQNTPPNTGTMNVTVSGIKNGAFTSSTTNWTACTFAHTAYSAAVNPSTPTPATPVPTQSPGAATAAVPAASIPPLVVGTPPANDNPNVTAVSATAPPVLGADVVLVGSTNAANQFFPKGNFGICQSIAVPAAAPYLTFWVWEGGSNYSFKTSDMEADILDSTGTTVQQTLFAEENCYLHPNTWGGSGVNTTSGCWPSAYGGDSSGYEDWIGGGFWSPRGPYDLSAYAGQTITLYIGHWSYYLDTANYYAQFLYLGSVQLLPTNSFPTTGPLIRGARTLSVHLPTREHL